MADTVPEAFPSGAQVDTQVPADPAGRRTVARRPLVERRASTRAANRPPRLSHRVVERRYRDNLNSQIDTFSSKLPTLRDSVACSLDVDDVNL